MGPGKGEGRESPNQPDTAGFEAGEAAPAVIAMEKPAPATEAEITPAAVVAVIAVLPGLG